MVAVSPDRGFTRWTMTVLAAAADRTETLGDVGQPRQRGRRRPVIGSTDGSLNPEALIDGTEATNWGGVDRGPGRRVEPVGLGRPRRRRAHGQRVQVSAYLTPAPPSPTTSRSRQDGPGLGLALHRPAPVRPRGVHGDCASRRQVDAVLHLARRRLPDELPRPVAPTLNLRAFDVPDTRLPPYGW